MDNFDKTFRKSDYLGERFTTSSSTHLREKRGYKEVYLFIEQKRLVRRNFSEFSRRTYLVQLMIVFYPFFTC